MLRLALLLCCLCACGEMPPPAELLPDLQQAPVLGPKVFAYAVVVGSGAIPAADSAYNMTGFGLAPPSSVVDFTNGIYRLRTTTAPAWVSPGMTDGEIVFIPFSVSVMGGTATTYVVKQGGLVPYLVASVIVGGGNGFSLVLFD